MKLRVRLAAAVLWAALALGSASGGQSVRLSLASPAADQLVEGRTYVIRWTGSGLQSVSITAEGELTSRPGVPRGQFVLAIADHLPAGAGGVSWQVPFLDTVRFQIRIRAYDNLGLLAAEESRDYYFRPGILANRHLDGIYVDLRSPEAQRLYVMRHNVVVRAYLASGSRTHRFLTKAQDSPEPHDHVGVFRVTEKFPLYWSNEYQVWMTHALRIWRGHFIHGTYPSEYHLLGHPASSGCIRLDRRDARELYDMTPIGTRVELFGGPL